MAKDSSKIKVYQKIVFFISLVILNFASALGGASVWMLAGNHENNSHYLEKCVLVGALYLLTMAAFGCIGSIKGRKCLMWLNATMATGWVIFMVVSAILIVAYHDQVNNAVVASLKDSMMDYIDSWDSLQSEYNCCGVTGANDWGDHIPNSCSIVENSAVIGCYEVWLKTNMLLIVVFASILMFLAFADLIFSAIVIFNMTAYKRVYRI